MLEVADIFRYHGPAWREANRGHISLGQLKVMSAIERCRTAALRAKFIAMLSEAQGQGRMEFHNRLAGLVDKRTFKRFLGPLRHTKWVVYCKPPFAGPEAVLRYLSRYTHRVAISNRRLVAADDGGICSAGRTTVPTASTAGRRFRLSASSQSAAAAAATLRDGVSSSRRRATTHVKNRGAER
jgi:hypothetical protein